MTFTITGWWIVPLVITILCLIGMLKPSKSVGHDSWGVGAVVDAFARLLYIIPIMGSWLVYLIVRVIWDIH